MEPYELLKQATAKKKAGDLESAIKLLRNAYKEISKSSIAYPVNTFLRLPAYLQEGGKSDEAWRELNNMLAKGYPHQSNDPRIVPIDHSAIYDAMRLFLQREGKNGSAVKFGVLSYICGALSLYRQSQSKDEDRFFILERKDRLKKDFSRENIESTVTKLLKKAKKEELGVKVSAIVEEYIKKLPNIKLGELVEEIDRVVLK
jgi:hypothetical protein